MKEREYVGLIVMVYDYVPSFAEIESTNSLPLVVQQVIEFLTRKKFFEKFGDPTEKMYKLLRKYDIHIERLENKENDEERQN